MDLACDGERVRRALAGDRAAFDRLHDEGFALVWAFCARRAQGRDAAEALATAILTRAWQRLAEVPARVEGELDWRLWLFAVARGMASTGNESASPLAEAPV
jgi:DNA-directed RNA polymerase specialized sigma24 family protein